MDLSFGLLHQYGPAFQDIRVSSNQPYLVRIACGIVVIFYEKNKSSIGLAVASLILLDAGFLPLVNATVGLLRIM